MNCELCRIHNRKRRASNTVVIDGIEYELCYDCMMEYVTTGRGEVLDDFEHIRRYWASILRDKHEQS